jgi:hypothetical protein
VPGATPLPPPDRNADGSRPTRSRTIPVAAWVLLGAGIVAVIGAVLPWATIAFRLDTRSLSDQINGTERGGVITLLLGLTLGGAAILTMLTGVVARWAAVFALMAATLMVLIAVVDITDVKRAAGDNGLVGLVTVDVGVGLWLTVVAGVAGLAGGVLALISARAAARAPSPRSS